MILQKKGGYIHILSHSLSIQGPILYPISHTFGIFQVKMEELQLELEETQRQLDQVKARANGTTLPSLTANKSAGAGGKNALDVI